MPVHHLDHLNLRASGNAFAALREFYCQVLGLRVGERPPLASAGLWLYAGAAPIVHLVELPEGAVPSAEPSAAPDLVFDHVAFACSGLEEVLSRLEKLGVPNTVQANPVTGQVLVRLKDPSGLRVELVFPAGRPGG
ncbi:MAG TPA: VOC family protein [Steroidobacteraceae bacterium]